MKGRLFFAAGLATGYVLGSRAGRSAYNNIRDRFQSAVQSPQVQGGIAKVKEVAEDRAPKLTSVVTGAAATGASKAAEKAEANPSVPDEAVSTLNEAASNLSSTSSDLDESTSPTASD